MATPNFEERYMSVTPVFSFFPSGHQREFTPPSVTFTTLVNQDHACVHQLAITPRTPCCMVLSEVSEIVSAVIVHDGNLLATDKCHEVAITLTPGRFHRLTIMGLRREAVGDMQEHLPALMVAPATPEMVLQIESLRESKAKNPRPLRIVGQAFVLLALVADSLASRSASPTPEHLATEILEQHLSNPPSIAELASLCSTSRATLARRFRSAFGMTVREYLRRKRLEAAHALLIREGLTVTEAALAVGYDSLPSFSRAFHAHFGHPPMAVRAASRLSPERTRPM